MMDKKISDYLNGHRVIYFPNFWTYLQVGQKDTQIILDRLVRDGKLKKVFIPKYYSIENQQNQFMEEFATTTKKVTKKMIEKMEEWDGITNEDQIEWAEGYLVK